ncbi:acid-sensing ion channel 1-like isoform X3 [Lethenteron reissneri]|uniref:acid-sensing ion channel 1-like isoform X3 n=1 Tax=Lethenteron reissneri TaxID=7753 RepID=UPI002AB72B17|nr:acid-sensing ion channel 1-like isoform X3 [Lethenteron reissneri]
MIELEETERDQEPETITREQNALPCRPRLQTHHHFAYNTKLHGVKYIFLSRHWFLWLLAVLTSVSLLLTWSNNRVHYLLSHPVHTNMQMVFVHNLTFPTVTFCNNNLLRFYKMTRQDLHLAGNWLGLLTDNGTARPEVLDFLEDTGRKTWFKKFANFSMFLPAPVSNLETLHLINRSGHQLDEMLLDCKFRGRHCTLNNFSTVFTRYGKCYMFNSGKDGRPLLTTLKGGTGNGLEIMLDIQQDEYLPVWGETDETSFEAGVRVQIHSQSEPPFIHELGFGVAPGFQTFVSTQEQRLIYLPSPWGDCKADPINSDFFDTYSITACRIDCETRYVVENCNCRMVHMPGDAPYCTPEQYKECADPALDFLVEKDNNYCVCDTPCNTTRYGKELSMVKIPSKASAKYLAKKYNKTEDYIRENVLVLDIFFEALNYETIEQKKAYEVAGLLGDIGGQMGLFIGASILTILEIFDYLYEVLKDKVCKCRKKHSKKRSENMTPCETLRSHHSQDVHFNSSILPHHTVRGTFEDFAC